MNSSMPVPTVRRQQHGQAVYTITGQEIHDLLTVVISDDETTSEQLGVQASFALGNLSVNQFILNRLSDIHEREAWHYSMVTQFSKEIDGDLADWSENEILGTDDAQDIYPEEFDLTGIYVSYDAEAEYLHFGVPVHLAGELPDDTRLYYVLAFDDNPTGVRNNYDVNDPFPLWLYCGFENARTNKLVNIKIPHIDYYVRNAR
jgi:hypothetical protein